MWSMTGRPCNPGNDLKRLWQIFLRDTPMPQCATQEGLEGSAGAEANGESTLPTKSAAAAKPSGVR